MPEKSELRERLEASVLPACPECKSSNVSHHFLEHSLEYVFKCQDCGTVFNTEK